MVAVSAGGAVAARRDLVKTCCSQTLVVGAELVACHTESPSCRVCSTVPRVVVVLRSCDCCGVMIVVVGDRRLPALQSMTVQQNYVVSHLGQIDMDNFSGIVSAVSLHQLDLNSVLFVQGIGIPKVHLFVQLTFCQPPTGHPWCVVF